MNCVFKEYEIKTKMVNEQCLQLKMLFYLGYNLEIVNLKTPFPTAFLAGNDTFLTENITQDRKRSN